MSKKNYSNWSKTELIKEVEKLAKRKKYGVVWENKDENVVLRCSKELPIFKEIKSKKILSDKNKPYNILIEGDNYHALSALNYTHKGKIDIIYIDPPYNTGAKDWKYNNDYVDIIDVWRHSKWLCMMEKRLRLAKSLLKKNGVLICTIDKNEHAALNLLMQELFPKKEIVSVVIIHNPAGVQGKNFSYTHEFANYVYPNKGQFIGKTARDKDLISNFRDWGPISLREHAKNCFYPIFVKNMKVIGFGDVCNNNFKPKFSNIKKKNGIIEVYPIDNDGVERKWVFSRESVEAIQNELFCKNVKGKIDIWRKKEAFTYRTVWNDKRYYANIYGSKLLNNIIKARFPFPKSLYAVMDCIKAVIHDKNNAIILDFFAGSGTTGHAVLELNKKDGGKRQFILCTNNEDNNNDGVKIASDICYPRLKKVIGGYKGLVDKKVYKGLKGNLKYFKTDFVDGAATDYNRMKLVDNSTEMLCLKEGCFDSLRKNSKYNIFKSAEGKYLGIVYDDGGIKLFKKEIKKINKKFIVYVFSLDESTREEEFEDISNLVELKPIPEVILNVYKKIFK